MNKILKGSIVVILFAVSTVVSVMDAYKTEASKPDPTGTNRWGYTINYDSDCEEEYSEKEDYEENEIVEAKADEEEVEEINDQQAIDEDEDLDDDLYEDCYDDDFYDDCQDDDFYEDCYDDDYYDDCQDDDFYDDFYDDDFYEDCHDDDFYEDCYDDDFYDDCQDDDFYEDCYDDDYYDDCQDDDLYADCYDDDFYADCYDDDFYTDCQDDNFYDDYQDDECVDAEEDCFDEESAEEREESEIYEIHFIKDSKKNPKDLNVDIIGFGEKGEAADMERANGEVRFYDSEGEYLGKYYEKNCPIVAIQNEEGYYAFSIYVDPSKEDMSNADLFGVKVEIYKNGKLFKSLDVEEDIEYKNRFATGLWAWEFAIDDGELTYVR